MKSARQIISIISNNTKNSIISSCSRNSSNQNSIHFQRCFKQIPLTIRFNWNRGLLSHATKVSTDFLNVNPRDMIEYRKFLCDFAKRLVDLWARCMSNNMHPVTKLGDDLLDSELSEVVESIDESSVCRTQRIPDTLCTRSDCLPFQHTSHHTWC